MGRRRRPGGTAGTSWTASRARARGEEALELFREYRRTGDPEIRNRLVMMHLYLVQYLASRFAHRGEPIEDLVQVGSLALIRAVERFDPERGTQFTTFATPTIFGEIKRYFRDNAWRLKPPRPLQELSYRLIQANEALAQQCGRAPTVAEVAAQVGATEEEALAAMEFCSIEMISLDSPHHRTGTDSTSTLADELGAEDPTLRRVDNFAVLRKAIEGLDDRGRQIIHQRFFRELSQKEVAGRLRISQMHVSRLERQALGRLRELLGEAAEEEKAALSASYPDRSGPFASGGV